MKDRKLDRQSTDTLVHSPTIGAFTFKVCNVPVKGYLGQKWFTKPSCKGYERANAHAGKCSPFPFYSAVATKLEVF